MALPAFSLEHVIDLEAKPKPKPTGGAESGEVATGGPKFVQQAPTLFQMPGLPGDRVRIPHCDSCHPLGP